MSRGGAFEKRREKRSRRRLRVVFEADGARSGGYTTNLSLRGMQATAAAVFPTGTVVRGRLELPDGKQIVVEAKVRWAIKAVGALAAVHHKSMGLQLLGAPPRELFELLENSGDEEKEAPRGAGVGSAPGAAAARPAGAAAPVAAGSIARPSVERPEVRCTEHRGIAIGRQGTAHCPVTEAGPLTATAAAALSERAAHSAVDELLPADHESRGVKLALTIMDPAPLPAGSSVQATARVESLSDGGKFVDLGVELSELGRPLGTATLTLLIVRRRV